MSTPRYFVLGIAPLRDVGFRSHRPSIFKIKHPSSCSMATILLVSVVVLGVAAAEVDLNSSSSACTGIGDSQHDWLVAGCSLASTFSASTGVDGSVRYTLSNGIITRELAVNAATKVLSTTAISMPANATSGNLVRCEKRRTTGRPQRRARARARARTYTA